MTADWLLPGLRHTARSCSPASDRRRTRLDLPAARRRRRRWRGWGANVRDRRRAADERAPGLAPELRWRLFQDSVPAFSASTNPWFARSRAGAADAYLLGMQSEREWARAVVRDIARRYLASRRECVDAFVDRHFSLTGTLRLHRQAIGWDLLRVPANLLLSPATLAVSVASRIAARLGLARTAAWLDWHLPFYDTAVAREVSWLVTTELLQLPCVQPRRTYTEDSLADVILSTRASPGAFALTMSFRRRLARASPRRFRAMPGRGRRLRRSQPDQSRPAWVRSGSSMRRPAWLR